MEFVAGTNPVSATSNLSIDSVVVNGGNNVIGFDSVLSRTYSIEYNDSLLNSWSVLGAGVSGTGSLIEINDSTTAPERYYRVNVELE